MFYLFGFRIPEILPEKKDMIGVKKSIGIIRKNGLGDLLCALPLAAFLKERERVHVTFFIDKRASCLVPFLKGVDEWVIIPAGKKKYWSLLKLLFSCRKRFDLLLSAKPQEMKWVNLLLWGLKGKEKWAYSRKGWHARGLTKHFEQDSSAKHQTLKLLQMIDPQVVEVKKRWYPKIAVAKRWQHLKGPQPLVLISFSNNRACSRIEPELYKKLFRHEVKVIINCEEKDKEKALSLKLDVPSEVIVTPDFADFLSLIDVVDLVFVGDGGIMHLAAALDKPQVVLFAQTRLWEWKPLSDKAICLSHQYNVNQIPFEEISRSLQNQLDELRRLSRSRESEESACDQVQASGGCTPQLTSL